RGGGRARRTGRRTRCVGGERTRGCKGTARRCREESLRPLLSALAIAACLGSAAQAQPAAEFYKGKTIRVIVGTSPGDYDTWVRLIVRYLPQYIPGQPNFVVEN